MHCRGFCRFGDSEYLRELTTPDQFHLLKPGREACVYVDIGETTKGRDARPTIAEFEGVFS